MGGDPILFVVRVWLFFPAIKDKLTTDLRILRHEVDVLLSLGIFCLAVVALSQDDALPLPPTCYASTDWAGHEALEFTGFINLYSYPSLDAAVLFNGLPSRDAFTGKILAPPFVTALGCAGGHSPQEG